MESTADSGPDFSGHYEIDYGSTTTDAQRGDLFVIILSTGLFATFLAPQISLWGRGLRPALPIFFALCLVALWGQPRSWLQQFRIFIVPTLLGFAFVGMALLRYLLDPVRALLDAYVISAAVCIMLWIAIVMIRSLIPQTLEKIRWLTLLMLGVSLGLGIPVLLQTPGIARLTMADPSMTQYYISVLFPQGVANYAWYTPVACAWPVMANWLYNSRQRTVMKMTGWVALFGATVAVLLSTFTMATVILVAGILAWLVLMAIQERGWPRITAISILLIATVAFPTIYYTGLEMEATAFAIDKATRLFEGTLAAGILAGDETRRAELFVATLDTFRNHPILGAWGVQSGFYIGGHSSWADGLALFGVPGLLLWLGFLSPSWRNRRPMFSIAAGMAGGTLFWILLALGGLLNPTLISAIALILVWLFDEGGVWQLQREFLLSNMSQPFSLYDEGEGNENRTVD